MILHNFTYLKTLQIGVSKVVPVICNKIWTTDNTALTGHSTGSPVASWVFLSILYPFFCPLKVIKIALVWKIPSSLMSKRLWSESQNSIFPNFITFLFLSPLGAKTYSNDLITKRIPNFQGCKLTVLLPYDSCHWGVGQGTSD